MAKQFVLCKGDPQNGGITFVAGGDSRMPTFGPDVHRAAKFERILHALEFGCAMTHQLGGGAKQYRVHELTGDGQLIDVDPRFMPGPKCGQELPRDSSGNTTDCPRSGLRDWEKHPLLITLGIVIFLICSLLWKDVKEHRKQEKRDAHKRLMESLKLSREIQKSNFDRWRREQAAQRLLLELEAAARRRELEDELPGFIVRP
jgi:hypothetical protein